VLLLYRRERGVDGWEPVRREIESVTKYGMRATSPTRFPQLDKIASEPVRIECYRTPKLSAPLLGGPVPDRRCQSMNVKITDSVEIALRNMSDDNRLRVWAWIDNLKRWETDPFVQQQSKKLDADENIYMLRTSTDLRIFFQLEKDAITVLEVAKRAWIVASGESSGADER
jgi:mRNA-degrading endonuclease RelE of RelBE toxin-antitoxin system